MTTQNWARVTVAPRHVAGNLNVAEVAFVGTSIEGCAHVMVGSVKAGVRSGPGCVGGSTMRSDVICTLPTSNAGRVQLTVRFWPSLASVSRKPAGFCVGVAGFGIRM